MDFTIVVRGQTRGSGQEHTDASVPGQLADPSERQGYVFPGNPDRSAFVSGIRLCGESAKIGAGAKTGFQLCGLPVTWFKEWSGPQERWEAPISKISSLLSTHVLDRCAHSNAETNAFRTSTHETHSVAPEVPLAYPRVTGENHSNSKVPSSTSDLVIKVEGQHLHPLCHAVQTFTDALNEGWAHIYVTIEQEAFGLFQKANCILIS